MIKELVPLKAAAKRTDLGENDIRRGLKSGAITGVKLGRDWHLPLEEVDRLAREYPISEGVPKA